MLARVLLFLCLLTWLPAHAQAEKRMGLVIGNDSYANVPLLEKARSDARALSDTLTDLGFDITTVLDANRRDMNRAIAGFTARLQPGDTALVFYAGHGVEIDGENYLLPVDIEAPSQASEDFIKFESIGLSDILLRVQNTGARTTLMFIDACRDNPFAESTGRSIGGTRGLARVTAPEGTFVVFSAGARQQALDRLSGPDPDPNSVFTRILLPKLKEPKLELRQLVADVRISVRDLALQQNHEQFPAYYDELLGTFYFNTGEVPKPVEVAAAAPPATAPPPPSDLATDYARAQSLNTIFAYEAFLEKHAGADDLIMDIARRRLDELREGDAPEAPSRATTTVVAAAPQPTRRDIIRLTQQKLNDVGCSAGGADGVIGPRTRRAFAAFIAARGASLADSDLGSQKALDIVQAASGTVCKTVVAAATPAPATSAPASRATATAAAPQPAPPAKSSLAGTWTFSAKCPLFIRAQGTTTFRALGGGKYAVVTRDNLGNRGQGSVTEKAGGILEYRIVWQTGANDNYNGSLSSNRRQITAMTSVACRVTASR
jgi:hypothetical protein